jgi:hypothetical protein
VDILRGERVQGKIAITSSFVILGRITKDENSNHKNSKKLEMSKMQGPWL